MALSVSEVLDKLIGREDVSASINSLIPASSAVARMLEANGSRIQPLSGPVMAFSTLDNPTFSSWDNSSAGTSNSLAGDVGEAQAVTAYAIVGYPVDLEVDIQAFPQMFAQAMANGFAKYIDDRVLNTASVGVIPLASGISNVYSTTTVSGTTYQLYTDLNATNALVLADGFRPNGIIGELAEEANIYNAVSTTGQPVFTLDGDGNVSRVLGRPYASTYVDLANTARFVVGDWTKIAIGIYQGLQFKKFESGSVNIGGTEFNLIERKMVAVRAEARMAFKVTRAAAFAYLKG